MTTKVAECLTMDSAELASVLGVSEHTVRRLAASGGLPIKPIQLGRRRVFSRAQVQALLAAQEGKESK